ncbi:hypothetical protein [Rhizobium sophoriradicis]|uniref:hypothetical protein n=1 Tax=Rhizobium sophoriradicis TaxID=1535245 RepID=UPI001CEDBB0D
MPMEETELKDDLLWGGRAIARKIGRTERQIYHMLERGELPARKVCGVWVASVTNLTKFLTGTN